jgi:O-antigen ligase
MRQMLEKHVRLTAIYFVALAISLPIAILNISKLVALVTALMLLVSSRADKQALAVHRLWPMRLIGAAFVLFWISAFWSTGKTAEIFKSVAQHGNLLIIPIMYYLVRSRREATVALSIYFVGQLFLILSTCALYLHVPLPWKLTDEGQPYGVFTGYLDQPIMTAVFAAIAWHLRELLPQRGRNLYAGLIICLALGVIFFIFIGRTGHLVGLSLLTLAAFWEMPRRFRPAIVLVPLIIYVLALSFSPKVAERFLTAKSEMQVAIQRGNATSDLTTSTGIRLNFWANSIEAIKNSPWTGYGAGSWNSQYNAIQKRIAGDSFVEVSANSHQEYLFWGVELGLPGVALLLAIIFSFFRLSNTMQESSRRATQSVLVAIVIACLFNCALFDAYIGDYLCIALAFVICYGLKPTDKQTESSPDLALKI